MKLANIHTEGNIPEESNVKFNKPLIKDRDERVIWELFKEGDEESLVYIYQHYVPSLFNFGCQFSDRKEFVRDCIQDMFCDLINKRKRLSTVNSIKGYLFTCLKNRIIRGLQKEERLCQEQNSFEIGFSLNSLTISQTFEKEDYGIIEKELNALPTQQKEVILLYFYEGLSYKEIAEIFEIKVKSARTLTYRALDSLSSRIMKFKNIIFLLISGFTI